MDSVPLYNPDPKRRFTLTWSHNKEPQSWAAKTEGRVGTNTMNKSSVLEARFVGVVILLGGMVSLANYFTYRDLLSSHWDVLTNYHELLLLVRSVVSVCLFVIAGAICLKNTWGKIIGLLASVLMLALFVYWYFEKFRWLYVIGSYEGTTE